jgi:hypothetical protein
MIVRISLGATPLKCRRLTDLSFRYAQIKAPMKTRVKQIAKMIWPLVKCTDIILNKGKGIYVLTAKVIISLSFF